MEGNVCCLRQLHVVWAAAVLSKKGLLRTPDLAKSLINMDRETDRATVTGDRSLDRLTNPPHRVCRELESSRGIELLCRPNDADHRCLKGIVKVYPYSLRAKS